MEPVTYPCNGRDEASGGCYIYESHDPAMIVRRWQHGDNPEHSVEFSEVELMREGFIPVLWESGKVTECYKAGIDWLTRLHEYEDARGR